MSLSSSPEMRPKLEEVLGQMKGQYGDLLEVIFQEQIYTQGQHYQKLITHLAAAGFDPLTTWLIATDDDDLWHPKRTEVYSEYVQRCVPATKELFLSIQLADYIDGKKVKVGAGAVKGGTDVDRLVSKGKLKIKKAAGGESYWSYCIRLASYQDFFRQAADLMVEHRFWDVCFLKYLRYTNQYRSLIIPPSLEDGFWGYYWRFDNKLDHVTQLGMTVAEKEVRKDDDLKNAVAYNLGFYCSREVTEDVNWEKCFLESKLWLQGASPQRRAIACAYAHQIYEKEPLYKCLVRSPRCTKFPGKQ